MSEGRGWDREERLREAVARIRAWGEARDWCGHDPYDGLNSPLARIVPTRLGRRGLTQAVKLSPVNLRPVLGIRPARNHKAIGLVAAAYARLGAREEAERWLDWLVGHHVGAGDTMAWGYHFPVQTRVFAYARDTPNTIATSFVAEALLDGIELAGLTRFTDAARRAARYLTIDALMRGPDRTFFRYLPAEDDLIHNANAMAAAALHRTARVLDEPEWLGPAVEALPATLSAQRPDGAWPYAEGEHGWVDNFHTAYVLEALARFDEAADAVARGADYWRRELFLADGTPKFYDDRTYPIDAHCYASAVDAFVALGDLEGARRQARLLIERMLDPAGYVHFQQWPRWKSRVPLIRWSTAPSFRALAGLLRAEPSA
jgi:hypothetical protein